MKINQNLINRNHTPFARKKSDIQWIVIHYVGALGDAYANTEYYKHNQVGASADFFVGHGGDVWQANDYYNFYSWHCGGGSSGRYYGKCTNPNSIGIEMCVRKKSTATMNAQDPDWYFTDETVKAAAELTRNLMEELDIDADHVIRHYDVNYKWCPAPYCQNNTSHTWTEFKQLITGDQAKEEPGELLHAYQLNGLSEAEKIERMAPLYQAVQKETGMLSSVGLAQFCLESGFGTTDLAQNADNLHGMKCSLSGNSWSGSSWDGKSKYTKQTAEQTPSGQVYYVTVDFRKYACMLDSIRDRAAYFIGARNGSAPRYPNINQITDARKQVELIKAGGYATDINYVSKLMNLIDRFQLTRFDQVEQKKEVPTMSVIDKIIKAAQDMNATLKDDIHSGHKWTYSNTKTLADTFDNARLKNIRRVNCVRGVMWALLEAGLWQKNPGQWYGRKDGAIIYKSKAVREAMLKAFDITAIGNKTLSACLKDGTVQPGDIVTYKGINHVNMFLGGGKWLDTGHAYCKAAGEDAEFISWIGPTVYGAYTVANILRLKKTVTLVPDEPAKVMYCVQIGAFISPYRAAKRVAELKEKTGYDYSIVDDGEMSRVVSESFGTRAEAEQREKEIQAAGFKTFVKEA